MRWGYNTNGFAHHRLEDAIGVIARLGYRSVAITLDHHALNPFGPDLKEKIRRIRRLLDRHNLKSVIETGARFLLDPLRKHQPTLVSRRASDRARRLDFLYRAVAIARDLGSDVVSFWSGTADDARDTRQKWIRLADGCQRLCDRAEQAGVRLAFEPEPGMFVDTMSRYETLRALVGPHPLFGLTLDIGHLYCQREVPIADYILRWRDVLWNVHIEDMRRGVHDHLMFGDGEIDFPPVLAALRAAGYAGGVHVELSRHSHDAVETARQALAFLRHAGRDSNPARRRRRPPAGGTAR